MMQSTIRFIRALILSSIVLSLGCGTSEDTPVDVIEATTHALTPQQIAEIALRSTVYLRFTNTQGDTLFGTGFVVGEGGLIATTYHAATDMKSNSTARLVNAALVHPIEAIVAVDARHDLAIVQCSKIVAPPLPLGDSDTVRIGDTVYVAGNPEKYIGTFSVGYISAIQPGDEFVADTVLQMTAPVSHGSSGGPVLNDQAEVIGVVSNGDTAGQLLNFAAPVNFLKTLLAGL